MNKNTIDFFIICICIIFAFILVDSLIPIYDNSQEIIHQCNDDSINFTYFTFNGTTYLITPHTCYAWNGSAWVFSEVEYGVPDGYVSGELFVPELTWINITEKRWAGSKK